MDGEPTFDVVLMYHRLFHNVMTVAQPESPVNTEKPVAGKDLSTISIIVVDGICVSSLRSFGRWSLCIGMPPVHMDDDRGSQRFLVKIMVQACEVAPLAVAFLVIGFSYAQRCPSFAAGNLPFFGFPDSSQTRLSSVPSAAIFATDRKNGDTQLTYEK